MPTTPRAAKNADGTDSEGPTYFELTTEIDEEDLPRPIRVPARRGAKAFVIEPIDTHRFMAMRTAPNMNDYDAALLGDAYDAAVAMYGGARRELWAKFISNVENHFYGRGASTAAAPGK